ncbi:copper chaperone PCu(A)C [uncultured Serinicoccus sp.]|uniref:copper chaperone PCu(A)C n=1 Tax=uncultured Serinicoccus sp. TaxID=735514 RepID=UPI0026325E21|nr:copper chaperone PCu(A)C [uncultured Serinicoccus sp.]
MRTTHARSTTPALAAALTGLLALAACGTTEEDSPAGSVSTDGEAQVSITDPWVKAADEGMTAAFGTITNPGEEDVVVTAADTGVSTMMELHEMATGDSGEMVMTEKEGGIVVPAGGQAELNPGGDHLMLMDLTEPLEPGQDISITLTMEDGSRFSFDAPVRSFDGAEEEYMGDMEDMDDMEMDDSGTETDAP